MNGNGIIMYESDSLAHYGVLGMKWGHRKQRPRLSDEERAARRRKIAKGLGAAAGVAGAAGAGYLAYRNRDAIRRGARSMRNRADLAGKQRAFHKKYGKMSNNINSRRYRTNPKDYGVDMKKYRQAQRAQKAFDRVDARQARRAANINKRVNKMAGGPVPDYLNPQYAPKLKNTARDRMRDAYNRFDARQAKRATNINNTVRNSKMMDAYNRSVTNKVNKANQVPDYLNPKYAPKLKRRRR